MEAAVDAAEGKFGVDGARERGRGAPHNAARDGVGGRSSLSQFSHHYSTTAFRRF